MNRKIELIIDENEYQILLRLEGIGLENKIKRAIVMAWDHLLSEYSEIDKLKNNRILQDAIEENCNP